MTKMVRDRKTGRKRRVDPLKSRKAKMSSRKRIGKKLPAATKMKIKRSRARTAMTGRTKAGRKAFISKPASKKVFPGGMV